MTAKTKMTKRVMSVLLSIAVFMTCLPLSVFAANGATESATVVADPGTAHTWESMMGTDTDGNRYAGRVWVDKSVYTDGQTALLNTSKEAGSSFQVDLENDEAFQIIFSALGSSMTSTETTSSGGPMDVVLVLDGSTSMVRNQSTPTRMQKMIEAANTLIGDLLSVSTTRLGVVTYNADSETVLPFGSYNDGVVLSVNRYTEATGNGVISAKTSAGALLGKDSGFASGTNLQSGIDRGMSMLKNATNVEGRTPVLIVLTDGAANAAVRNNWYNISQGNLDQQYNTTSGVALSTMLNAAYNKVLVEKKYNTAPMVYGIGVDISSDSAAQALLNPAGSTNGFNSANSSSAIRTAYSYFNTWKSGEIVYIGNNQWSRYTFNHSMPDVTTAEVAANINYVDTYYNASSSEIASVFDQIYKELSSGAFNPITSTTSSVGGTGVDNTPLIYVDNIGKYMEIKDIQSITLFGASYNVTNNNDGTYTVAAGTGVNPTTNEAWNTSEDITISVTANADGSQRLEIRINQEILPIILEQTVSNTVGNVTNATISEIGYSPLRVYYTVGLDDNILLPNGEIDVTKIDSGYEYIDDTTGEITFYSNAFNVTNTADKDNDGLVDLGDAHVGFKPSAANRYYYHQRNQAIFSAVSAKNGSAINWDESEYGVVFDADKYDVTFLSYADYQNLSDDDQVYTYVTYHHPTPSNTDAANAAEEVTYLIYSDWGYLKESVAFYDNDAKVFVNYDATNGHLTADEGYAVPLDKVASTIASYKAANANADIKAVLGVGSLRTSRLHNMTVAKGNNNTQTANMRYAPEYTYETADDHNGNDVVVWLGNNGRLTTTVATGIALTKTVTEAIGNPTDTYDLTVTVPAGVNATPVVKNANGEDVTATISTYQNRVLTVKVKAGETVYVSGIPAGTECEIGEVIPVDAAYYVSSKTDKVTIPTLSEAISGTSAQYVAASVTNSPYKYGNLFITKEMESDHNIPESILNKTFNIEVSVGTDLAGKEFSVDNGTSTDKVTVDPNGKLNLVIKARQTLEILGLPAGTNATVTEVGAGTNFAVAYRTRNHSGETADNDNLVVIPEDANATAVITNTYTPNSTSVNLDIAGTKNFNAEGNHDGGSFNFRVEKWDGAKWVAIDGKTAKVEYAANEHGTKTFKIEDVLQGITYDEVGSHAYQVVEVKGNVTNVTYDRTLYTFTVTVTDNDGQLEATVTDLNNRDINGSYAVTFTNTYHTAPVSIDIEKVVDNKSGDPDISKAGFEFKAVQTDANWVALTGNAASTLTVHSDAAGEARLTATYENAGTYYYVVTEVNSGDKNGWIYSKAEYRVTVEVKEDNGNLTSTITIVGVSTAAGETATVDGNSGKVIFKNTYDPTDVPVDLDAAVKKNLIGKGLEKDAFTFKVYENGTTTERLSGKNDADGKVDFEGELTFDKIGKYEFDVVEVKGNEAGVTYDSTIYDLVVEVTNNFESGELEATYYFEDATGSTVTFNNVYTVTPTEYTISGIKHLTGRAMKAGEFEFALYEDVVDKNHEIEVVQNKADGTFTFSKLNYTTAGTHNYIIKEVKGNVAGVTYSDKEIKFTVKVEDKGSVLEATGYLPDVNSSDEKLEFTNVYDPTDAKVTFKGTKTLKGLPLTNNDFTFKLYKTDHTFDITSTSTELVATRKNVDGKFEFDELTFSETGSYFYVIVEDATVDPISNIVYDGTHYNLRVQISDVGTGELLVRVENLTVGITGSESHLDNTATEEVAFTNATFDEATEKEVYLEGSTDTHIDGKKVKAGDILTYFITYTNYTGQDVEVDIVDTIPAHTTYVDGSADKGGTYAGEHITWLLNVPKGESVTVSFDVKVDEAEAIVANTAVIRDGINTYNTNEVVNHTVDEPTKKDVFLVDDPTVSIDGKKVKAGDKLVYTISYTNASGEEVSVTIKDKIPEHTAYVEGSADNNGVYANGEITWNIEKVDAWSTVIVSFEVTVGDVVSANITNKATVVEGNNTYTTNEVSTTADNPVPTPPPVDPTPTPVAPQTGDNSNLWMWFALLFVSGGGIVSTSVFGLKKKEAEEN